MNEEPRHKMTVKILDSLRTIQGYSMDEYREARDELIDDLAKDLEAIQLAKAIGVAAPIAQGGPAVAEIPTFTPVTEAPVWGEPAPTPSASFTQATVPNCPHGPLKPLTGSGLKGPWKGWFCSLQKGDPAQCTPKFATRGTPEFNNFPA
jgi:hypothetical protein